MTVAHDTALSITPFTTTSPATASFTPIGTPKGILVLIAHGVESTDLITGVTYGGVAMTRIPTNGFAQDTAVEPGAAYAYFLGSGIPTGAQTVSIAHTGSTTDKWALVVSVTAAADTEIGASGKLQEDQTNPQIALDTGAISSLRYCMNYSGQANTTNLTAVTDTTVVAGNDFGLFVGRASRQNAAATGSFTIGWTASSDDCAMVAAAIREVGGAASLIIPRRSMAGLIGR